MQGAFSEEVLFARTILYRFLALAFHEPRKPLMDFLAQAEERQALQAASAEIDAQYETRAVGQAVDALLASQPAQGWPEQDLRVEYTRGENRAPVRAPGWGQSWGRPPATPACRGRAGAGSGGEISPPVPGPWQGPMPAVRIAL